MRQLAALLLAACTAEAAPAKGPACEGADLDLYAIMAKDACRSDHAKQDALPAGVTVKIDPALRAKSGAPAKSAIVIDNGNEAPAEFVFNVFCDADRQLRTSIENDQGTRVDEIGEVCGEGIGCGGYTARVVIAAHGKAHFPLALAARIVRRDKDCKTSDAGPLPAGQYKATINAQFLREELHAPIVVTK